jgi:hypothetical protein
MSLVARQVPEQETSAVEVVVYISKKLLDEQRDQVVSALKETDGIVEAQFCLTRHHLVLTKYDKNMMSSQDVLENFNSMNLDARLIGPI